MSATTRSCDAMANASRSPVGVSTIATIGGLDDVADRVHGGAVALGSTIAVDPKVGDGREVGVVPLRPGGVHSHEACGIRRRLVEKGRRELSSR